MQRCVTVGHRIHVTDVEIIFADVVHDGSRFIVQGLKFKVKDLRYKDDGAWFGNTGWSFPFNRKPRTVYSYIVFFRCLKNQPIIIIVNRVKPPPTMPDMEVPRSTAGQAGSESASASG